MQQINRMQLKFLVDFLVQSYEEFIEMAPSEAQMLAQRGNVPLDQLFLVVFAEQLAECRRDAKLLWPRSEGWLKFETHKNALFAGEDFRPVSYATPSDLGYVTLPASKCYDHLFWTLYRELGGDHDYETQEELVKKFQQCVSGLRILELGCGPGFALPVLEKLGAQAKGIDIRNLGIPEIFSPEIGDVRHLSQYYKAEEFDLVISHDFFCERVILSQEDTALVLEETYGVLKPGGRMISEINFFRMDAPIYFVIDYLILKNQRTVRDVNDYIDILFDSKNTIRPRWNNRLSIRIDDCVGAGFTECAVKPEAEYLTVVLNK